MNAARALAKMQPPPGAPAEAWAARISACWQASVHAILEVGRLLTAAKDALPHGAFEDMIAADLPFSNSTARRLMAVAGDPRLTDRAHVHVLPPSWGTLYELTKLTDEQFAAARTGGIIKPDMMRRDLEAVRLPAPRRPAPEPQPAPPAEPVTIEGTATEIFPAPPGDAPSATMPTRIEPDGLDFAPTPPWGTRALIEIVLPAIGITRITKPWEPACGEGHMAEVVAEYTPVAASDIHDYGYGDAGVDFLALDPTQPLADWIITNPPFNKAEEFSLQALRLARVGVAMFTRWQWIESVGRFERLFGPKPPAVVAVFAERIPLHMGRWEPEGDTLTAYCWVVWRKGFEGNTRLFWIPPGQRKALSKDDDAARFTTKPVTRKEHVYCDEPFDTESDFTTTQNIESEATQTDNRELGPASPEPVSEPDSASQAPDAGSPIPTCAESSQVQIERDVLPGVVEPAPAVVPSAVKGAGSLPCDDDLEIPAFLDRRRAPQPAAEAG
jgi:hypothetical protein